MKQPFFTIDPVIEQKGEEALALCERSFAEINETAEYNQLKIQRAFYDHRVSESHLHGTTGYGYDDRGRDTLDAVYAQVFGAEDALVRHHFASGTHTIATALFGVLRPGDKLLCVTGKPYDTLEATIGISGKAGMGSLQEFGVQYEQVELLPDSRFDFEKIGQKVGDAAVLYIQRSRGYALRKSLTVDKIGEVARFAKEKNPDIIVMVDNCYGEFVEKEEPTQHGADIMMGSLIKNPGGGIARTGGYIAGRKDLIERCSYRLTCPGVGREVGCSLEENRNMYMGFFFAPTVVASALKTSVFACALFSLLGFQTDPQVGEKRGDIIGVVELGDPEKLCAFCRGVQLGAPVDSFVTPEPWEMPGYDSPVIMAAGAFTMGASIELSADAPMREPYAVWMQGGLTFESGKIGALLAAQSMYEKGLLIL